MDRPYAGIDFRRRRSVIVRLSRSGERRKLHQIVNEPVAAPSLRLPRGPHDQPAWRRRLTVLAFVATPFDCERLKLTQLDCERLPKPIGRSGGERCRGGRATSAG
jgi:hypothetical protein